MKWRRSYRSADLFAPQEGLIEEVVNPDALVQLDEEQEAQLEREASKRKKKDGFKKRTSKTAAFLSSLFRRTRSPSNTPAPVLHPMHLPHTPVNSLVLGRSSLPKDWASTRGRHSIHLRNLAINSIVTLDLSSCEDSLFKDTLRALRSGRVESISIHKAQPEQIERLAYALTEPSCKSSEVHVRDFDGEVGLLWAMFFRELCSRDGLRSAKFDGVSLSKTQLPLDMSCSDLDALSLRMCNLKADDLETGMSLQSFAPKLSKLDLSGNLLGKGFAAETVSFSSLECLMLSSNDIDAEGCWAICDAILGGDFPKLNTLDVAGNPIGVDGAEALSLVMNRLQHLDVSYTNIGVNGAMRLVKMISKCPTLESLELQGVAMGIQVVVELCSQLEQTKTLRSLKVGGGSILYGRGIDMDVGEEGFVCILEAIKVNESLESVVILGPSVSETSKTLLNILLSQPLAERPALARRELFKQCLEDASSDCGLFLPLFKNDHPPFLCGSLSGGKLFDVELSRFGVNLKLADPGTFIVMCNWLVDAGLLNPLVCSRLVSICVAGIDSY